MLSAKAEQQIMQNKAIAEREIVQLFFVLEQNRNAYNNKVADLNIKNRKEK